MPRQPTPPGPAPPDSDREARRRPARRSESDTDRASPVPGSASDPAGAGPDHESRMMGRAPSLRLFPIKFKYGPAPCQWVAGPT